MSAIVKLRSRRPRSSPPSPVRSQQSNKPKTSGMLRSASKSGRSDVVEGDSGSKRPSSLSRTRRVRGGMATVFLVMAVWFIIMVIVFGPMLIASDSVKESWAEERDAALKELQTTVDELRVRYNKLSEEHETVTKSRAVKAAPAAERQNLPPPPPAAAYQAQGAALPIPVDSSTSPQPLVDPTYLVKAQPELDADLAGLCRRRNDGDEDILRRMTVWEGAEMGLPRILCMSYTLSRAHDSAVANLRKTWAQRCDGYIAMSDLTDPEVPSVDIKHNGPEAYDNMWQKVRSIWLYVHKHHRDDFDYFMIGGDDLFVVVDNLRRYLLSEEIMEATEHGAKPIFLGRRFHPPGEEVVFNSGGAGYVMNAAALDVLAQGLQGDQCRPRQVGFWEDVNVAYCLSRGGVLAYDTRDALGRERFLPFTPGNHLLYRVPKNPDWYAKYAIELKTGFDCCSPEAISFHYVKGDLMLRYYAIVYGLCPIEGQGGAVLASQ